MGKFVSKIINNAVRYEVIEKKHFNSINSLAAGMKFERFVYSGKTESVETYYDTPANLLGRAGILFSREVTSTGHRFKIQRATSVTQNFIFDKDNIFIHEIGSRDKIMDHMLYLIDGISTLYGTSFSIDLENILKTVVPKLEILKKSKIITMISGTGFRANIFQQEITYKNFETKRKVKRFGVYLENDSPLTYANQFKFLEKNIEKYCKEFLPIKEEEYDYALRVTKKLQVKPKSEIKKTKEKKVNLLDKIEG